MIPLNFMDQVICSVYLTFKVAFHVSYQQNKTFLKCANYFRWRIWLGKTFPRRNFTNLFRGWRIFMNTKSKIQFMYRHFLHILWVKILTQSALIFTRHRVLEQKHINVTTLCQIRQQTRPTSNISCFANIRKELFMISTFFK